MTQGQCIGKGAFKEVMEVIRLEGPDMTGRSPRVVAFLSCKDTVSTSHL